MIILSGKTFRTVMKCDDGTLNWNFNHFLFLKYKKLFF